MMVNIPIFFFFKKNKHIKINDSSYRTKSFNTFTKNIKLLKKNIKLLNFILFFFIHSINKTVIIIGKKYNKYSIFNK